MTSMTTATQHGQFMSRVAGACPVAASSVRPEALYGTRPSTLVLDAAYPQHTQISEQPNLDFAGIWNLSGKREHRTAIT